MASPWDRVPGSLVSAGKKLGYSCQRATSANAHQNISYTCCQGYIMLCCFLHTLWLSPWQWAVPRMLSQHPQCARQSRARCLSSCGSMLRINAGIMKLGSRKQRQKAALGTSRARLCFRARLTGVLPKTKPQGLQRLQTATTAAKTGKDSDQPAGFPAVGSKLLR